MSTPADEIALARLTDARPEERGWACEAIEAKRAKVSREVFDALVALLSDVETYEVSTWSYAQGETEIRYEVATLAAKALCAIGSHHVAWLDEAYARLPAAERVRVSRALPPPPFERLDASKRDPPKRIAAPREDPEHEGETTESLRANLRGAWDERMLTTLGALTSRGEASAAALPEIVAILRTPEAQVPNEGAGPWQYYPVMRAACAWVAAAGPASNAALADVVPLLWRQPLDRVAVAALEAHRPLDAELRETLRVGHPRLVERWVDKRMIEPNRDLVRRIWELFGRG